MSTGAAAWNAYFDEFGKEPVSAQKLQSYTKQNADLDNLTYKTARVTFSENQGKGRIENVTKSKTKTSTKPSKSKAKKKASKPPPKSKTKSKKGKSKPPPVPTTTQGTNPSTSELEDDQGIEGEGPDEETNLVSHDESDEEDAAIAQTNTLTAPTSLFHKRKGKKGAPPMEMAKSTSMDTEQERTNTTGTPSTPWIPTPHVYHDDGNINYTQTMINMKDETSRRRVWLALVLSLCAMFVSVFVTTIVGSALLGELARREEMITSPPIAFEGMAGTDESLRVYVGGYGGWEYASWRATDYRDSEGEGYLSAGDIQYPFPDIHIKYGDILVFKSRSGWLRDDIFLVPEEVYESCNFSHPHNLTDSFGDMTNASRLFVAGPEELYCDTRKPCDYAVEYACEPGSACEFEFDVEEWSEYDIEDDDDIFGVLVTADTLYFVSSYNWDRTWSQSCAGGLKQKVHVDKTHRKLMPLKEVSDAWRAIAKTEVVSNLHAAIGHISRMLILSQFNFEQRIRSEGDSGLTTVRGNYDGDAAYDDGTYTNGAVASIHDHANNIIVVGIGEIGAVLNGVEFNTRHNDYNLMMPSEDDDSYGATQEIDSPPVPPEVSGKATVAEEVAEMQEWFRAFGTQNLSHRNYSAYFKPILCYLEGVWIMDDEVLEEPFASDRHAIDARSWKQLHDKIRWMSNSGRKNSLENLAHLPSSIRNLLNDTYPVISNWEYRILCAPMANDIGTARFRIVNDLSVQLMGAPETRDELEHSRRARFELNRDLDDNNLWNGGRKRWNYLDHLMEQIPGKNNYGANLTDVLPDGSDMCIHYMTDEVLNSAYYSRYFGLSGKDAMGSVKHRRGWSDRNLFAAQTTHTKVSPIAFNFEETDEDGKIVYIETESRWSYAIPLEIIYQTPISKWNPYGVEYVDRSDYDYTRSGDCEGGLSEAFDGWTINNAYFTPAEFYEGLTTTGAADTHADNVCAIGKDGAAHSVYASGHWISFPEIGNGVGRIRQRYPIFPIHAAGSAPFKETKALQSVVLDDDYDDTETNPDGFFGDNRDKNYGFEINLNGGGHQHVMYVSGWRVTRYWYHQNGTELSAPQHVITAESDTRNSHAHTVELWRQMQDGQWIYNIARCRLGSISDADQYGDADWTQAKCHDNHNSLQRFG